jgi:hypothetical protein
MTDIGECFVGAYLQHFYECDIISYNVKDNISRTKTSQNEIDVIGISLKDKKVYLCEVKTHIGGYGPTGNNDRIKSTRKQFNFMQDFANKKFNDYEVNIMFWCSKVSNVKLLTEIKNLYQSENIIIDKKYTDRIIELIVFAKNNTSNFENPFLRTLQIAKHSKAI